MKKVNSDVAYDYIRKRILSGEYVPGFSLMTEVLALEIGVSRTPVREALHKLKADGLVSIRARLGASVKKVDVKEFREMCDLRLALEGHAAGLAALNHGQADLREIKFALDAMRDYTERINAADQEHPLLDSMVQEDVRFHIAIMTAANGRRADLFYPFEECLTVLLGQHFSDHRAKPTDVFAQRAIVR